MMRWVIRLGLAGLLVGLAVYAWTMLNQDDDEEELEDEIPIEFDIPMEAIPSSSDSASASANGHDTGVGPGEDRQASTPDDGAPSQTTQVLEADTDGAEESGTSEDSHNPDDLTQIRGIGPVFQQRLSELGISTFRQLADVDRAGLEEAGIQGVGVDLDSWIEQARALANGEPA